MWGCPSPETEELRELPLGSSELGAVLNQVTLCELPPINSFHMNKNLCK